MSLLPEGGRATQDATIPVIDKSMQEDLINPDLESSHLDMQQVTGITAIAVSKVMHTYYAYPPDSSDDELGPQKDINDTVATQVMTDQYNKLPHRTKVAAEGKKDKKNGAKIPLMGGIYGKGDESDPVKRNAVVDPLECTGLSVKKEEGVTSAAAEFEPGGAIELPDEIDRMQKFFAPNVEGLSMDDPADISVIKVARGLGVDYSRIRVTILRRPRNQQWIDDLRQLESEGLVLNLIDAGDMLPAVMSGDEPDPTGMYNMVMGIGGAPEGLIAAAAAKATGATFVEGRFWHEDPEIRQRHSKKLSLNDLIPARADSIVVKLAHITSDSKYTGQKGVREYQNGHTQTLVDFTSVDINGRTHKTKAFDS